MKKVERKKCDSNYHSPILTWEPKRPLWIPEPTEPWQTSLGDFTGSLMNKIHEDLTTTKTSMEEIRTAMGGFFRSVDEEIIKRGLKKYMDESLSLISSDEQQLKATEWLVLGKWDDDRAVMEIVLWLIFTPPYSVGAAIQLHNMARIIDESNGVESGDERPAVRLPLLSLLL